PRATSRYGRCGDVPCDAPSCRDCRCRRDAACASGNAPFVRTTERCAAGRPEDACGHGFDLTSSSSVKNPFSSAYSASMYFFVSAADLYSLAQLLSASSFFQASDCESCLRTPSQ